MNNYNNDDGEKKDKNYDGFPKSERLTAAFLLFSVLAWGIYDSFTTGNLGVPWYLIIMTSAFNVIARKYLKKENENE
ncbi:hypothetical protein ACIQYL_09115 [Lysinibacillus xylanilyticus]|uniref:hypothetical protein n=1 Tax=Lysinibacillus xylanilyticus TaxID=582475 RepID=UPI003826BA3F